MTPESNNNNNNTEAPPGNGKIKKSPITLILLKMWRFSLKWIHHLVFLWARRLLEPPWPEVEPIHCRGFPNVRFDRSVAFRSLAITEVNVNVTQRNIHYSTRGGCAAIVDSTFALSVATECGPWYKY